jgi:hypothetical protein
MSGPFRELHQENKIKITTIAIQAIGSFLIHEERP